MKKIWFYFQPVRTTLSILSNIVKEIRTQKCYGGALLNVVMDIFQENAGWVKQQKVIIIIIIIIISFNKFCYSRTFQRYSRSRNHTSFASKRICTLFWNVGGMALLGRNHRPLFGIHDLRELRRRGIVSFFWNLSKIQRLLKISEFTKKI